MDDQTKNAFTDLPAADQAVVAEYIQAQSAARGTTAVVDRARRGVDAAVEDDNNAQARLQAAAAAMATLLGGAPARGPRGK